MTYFVQLKRLSSFIPIKGIKHALAHSFELHIRANFLNTSGGYEEYIIQSNPFMAAKKSVLGLIMSFPPYLRYAMARFPLMNHEAVCRAAPGFARVC